MPYIFYCVILIVGLVQGAVSFCNFLGILIRYFHYNPDVKILKIFSVMAMRSALICKKLFVLSTYMLQMILSPYGLRNVFNTHITISFSNSRVAEEI